MVIPSAMASVNLAVLDGGDFAHGRGDGTVILAHDGRVLARDRRAHLDVRVSTGSSVARIAASPSSVPPRLAPEATTNRIGKVTRAKTGSPAATKVRRA